MEAFTFLQLYSNYNHDDTCFTGVSGRFAHKSIRPQSTRPHNAVNSPTLRGRFAHNNSTTLKQYFITVFLIFKKNKIIEIINNKEIIKAYTRWWKYRHQVLTLINVWLRLVCQSQRSVSFFVWNCREREQLFTLAHVHCKYLLARTAHGYITCSVFSLYYS